MMKSWLSSVLLSGSNALLPYAFSFAILFALIASAEHAFAVWQVNSAENDDLLDTVKIVRANLVSNGRLDLSSYRQWDNSEAKSDYIIITATGELVDSKGDIGALLGSAIPPDRYLPRTASKIQTDLGEAWLLENVRLSDGSVIAGISATDQIGLNNPRSLLDSEMRRFGGTVEEAAKLNTKTLRNYLSGIVIVNDAGVIVANENSVPLRVETNSIGRLLNGQITRSQTSDGEYALLPISVNSDKGSLRIIAFDPLSNEAVDQSLLFNVFVAIVAWCVALFGLTFAVVKKSLKQQTISHLREMSTRQLIALGENAPVEFKSTLRRNLFTNKDDPQIKLSILKTIAAFLNTDGGHLLVGVADNRQILGLASDGFSNNDQLLLFLADMIRDGIGNIHAPRIKPVIETMDNNVDVLRIDCERSSIPAYVKTEKGQQAFYVRTGPSTRELMVSEVHTYILNHFMKQR